MTTTAAGPDRRRRNTWIMIALAVVGTGLMCCVALALGGILFYVRHVNHKSLDSRDALAEFENTRKTFATRTALVELPEAREWRREDFGRTAVVVHRTPEAPRRPVNSLHILAYDPNQERLTSVDLPGWLLRLMTVSGKVRLANAGFLKSDEIMLEDLERHGPGLVLQTTTEEGSRVLVWSE
jgi:hypothetical protein